jgi:twitching motility protein PilU
LPSISGGLVPAMEVMLNEALVRELIQKGEYDKITDVMEQNNRMGMCSFDQSLIDLYSRGLITEETVLSQADKTSDIKIKMQTIKMGAAGGDLRKIDTSIFND